MRFIRFMMRIGGWIGTGVVVALLLAVIVWFTLPLVLKWQPQVVLTGSMEPTLPLGSVVFVAPRAPEEVQVGDVLTFRHPERPKRLATHRVTQVLTREDGSLAFKTLGDANEVEDPWQVPGENVIGTVVYYVPYMGYVTERVRTREGFLVIIGVPASIVILGEVRNIVRELRRPRKEGSS